MRHISPTLELDAYLRLSRASFSEWLAAIREMSGCDDVECRLHRGGGQVGALSALGSDSGTVVCAYASQAMDITGCRSSDSVILMPRAGSTEISIQNGPWEPLEHLVLARPVDRSICVCTRAARFSL